MTSSVISRNRLDVVRTGAVGAWLAILPVSNVSAIVFDLWHRQPPPWLSAANLAAAGLFVALAYAIASWDRLRGYFLALLALAAGSVALEWIEQSSLWAESLSQAKPYHATFARALAQVLPCALLALTLVGSGLTRRDVFITRGDMSAPCSLPFGRRVSWTWLGAAISILLAGGLAVQLTLTLAPDARMLSRALTALPLAIAFAAVNAAQEEFQYRAVLLARLRPVVGSTQALAITSALFGLAHWFGHPSGASGVLMAGFAGWVWGRSMLDTGGSAWAWLIHAVQDVVIFTFLVAAAA